MALTRVTDFGKAGLNVDLQPSMVEPGAWTTFRNIDIENGDIRSAIGEDEISFDLPIEPKYVFSFTSRGTTSILVSDGTSVWSYDDYAVPGTFVWRHISNAMEVTGDTGGIVTFTTFLGTLVINFSEGVAGYWVLDDNSQIQQLSGWDDDWSCFQIIAYKNFLFAIGMSDSTGTAWANYPTDGSYVIAWSDAAAAGEIPSSWLPTPENLAGQVQLADTTGKLVCARILRDDLIVYKDDSIYRGYYTGDEFIFRFDRAINDRGCDSYRGATALSGVHFFCDRDDIRIFDGQNTKSIVIDRVRDKLANAIDNETSNLVQLMAWPGRDEVYVSIPSPTGIASEEVLVYNVDADSWSFKEHPGLLCLALLEATGAADLRTVRKDRMLYGVDSPTANKFQLQIADDSNTNLFGDIKFCGAERSGMIITDLQQSVTMRAVYPEVTGDAPVSISIGCQWHANDVVRWTTPYLFTPGVDKRVPTRITGIPTAFRITSFADGKWSLGAVSFSYTPAGQR